MSQECIIRNVVRAPGGYIVTVETTEAYVGGASRFEELAMTVAEFEGKTPDEQVEAVRAAIEDDPFAAVKQVDIEHWKRLKQVSAAPLADIKRVFGGKP